MARVLTPEQAATAVYFDFEGCVGQAPSLLGLSLVGEDGSEDSRQWIVEPRLWGAARTVPHTQGAVRCRRATLDAAVAELVCVAEEQDRRLVSWARHDMTMIERHVGDPDLVARASRRYMNALPTARQWLRCLRPEVSLERTRSGKHRLSCYRELMQITLPEKFDQDVAAKGIRAMRDAVERHGSFTDVPAGSAARKRWKAVLGHNRLDCKNAREIVTRAAAEYAAA